MDAIQVSGHERHHARREGAAEDEVDVVPKAVEAVDIRQGSAEGHLVRAGPERLAGAQMHILWRDAVQRARGFDVCLASAGCWAGSPMPVVQAVTVMTCAEASTHRRPLCQAPEERAVCCCCQSRRQVAGPGPRPHQARSGRRAAVARPAAWRRTGSRAARPSLRCCHGLRPRTAPVGRVPATGAWGGTANTSPLPCSGLALTCISSVMEPSLSAGRAAACARSSRSASRQHT